MSQMVKVDEALDELGLDLEDFVEFVEELRSFAAEALPELKKAVSTRNFIEIRAQAHALKGALANLRFVDAAQYAYALEMDGKNSQDADLDQHLTDFEDMLKKSFAEWDSRS
jgi:HPt (histidine-containing phosphotransfer) domain-containing protein